MQRNQSKLSVLARPLKSGWAICSVVVGLGFALMDATVLRHDLRGRLGAAAGIVLIGGGGSVLLAALFHAGVRIGAGAVCGDRVLSGTSYKRFLTPALIAALLFAACWWLVAIIAFPLIVIGLGFSWREGLDFVEAEPRLAILFSCMPLIAILTAPLQALHVYLLVRRKHEGP